MDFWKVGNPVGGCGVCGNLTRWPPVNQRPPSRRDVCVDTARGLYCMVGRSHTLPGSTESPGKASIRYPSQYRTVRTIPHCHCLTPPLWVPSKCKHEGENSHWWQHYNAEWGMQQKQVRIKAYGSGVLQRDSKANTTDVPPLYAPRLTTRGG